MALAGGDELHELPDIARQPALVHGKDRADLAAVDQGQHVLEARAQACAGATHA